MSHKQDRERAESGIIFRDGKLVNKEEWYKAHPTREMRLATLKVVKAAVEEEMAKKTVKSEFKPAPYLCEKCSRTHNPGTKVYEAHRQFMSIENPNYQQINIPLKQEV
jgi:hypothetical protein